MVSPDGISDALAPDVLAPAIARELGLSGKAVKAALFMLASGDHVPFVIRHRRERIGGLSAGDLERIQRRAAAAAKLEFDRFALRQKLAERRRNRAELMEAVDAIRDIVDLEDVRALTRKRKKDGTAKFRAAKLDRLAAALWELGTDGGAGDAEPEDGAEPKSDEAPAEVADEQGPADPAAVEDKSAEPAADEETSAEPVADEQERAEPAADEETSAAAEDGAPAEDGPAGELPTPEELAVAYQNEELTTPAAVLDGARAICVADILGRPQLRRDLRELVIATGKLRSQVVAEKKEKAGRFSALFNHAEPCKSIPASRLLGMWRGEREGALQLSFEVDVDAVRELVLTSLAIDPDRPCGAWLSDAARQAWEGPLGAAVFKGVRRRLKARADRRAIAQYSENLRPLLLAPALGDEPVLAIDPGFQHGCRVVVLDKSGVPVAEDTVYPLEPKLQAPQTKARLTELCKEHGIAAIAVGSANGGRDVERLCREIVAGEADLEAAVTSIDGEAAALAASSRAAKDELKDSDAATRRAVSLGRRLQDPLRELGKLDLRKLGLGQYQHEVDQEELRDALDQVLASCISEVGADLNAAPVELLARVSGIGQALAKAMVARREQKGPFRRRTELLDLPGFAGKAFEQSAGFLRVSDGEQPLDRTAIHPERYGQVTEMARDLGVTLEDLVGNGDLVGKIEADKYLGKAGVSGELLGRPGFDLIVRELRTPGADPRPEFTPPTFHPGLAKFEDLEVGMKLDGVVSHLASFGAFIDVGLAEEGLVHVSELAHGFISNPADAVHVGQKVKGLVREIDPEKKRFSLSLKALLPMPAPAPDDGKRAKGKKRRKKPPAKERGRDRGKPRKQGERRREPDRVLEFRMDLSALAAQLEDGD